MSNEDLKSPESATDKWYTSIWVVLLLFLISFLVWFALVSKASLDSEIKTTHLILKSEGCNFLKMSGIAIKAMESSNGCAVVVPFRQNLFGNGGLILLERLKIRIADEQVVIIGSIEEQSWTAERIHAAIWIGVSFLVMFGLMVWLVIRLFSERIERT